MNTNEIARIASLVGEPARTAMLLTLMDGRALTANELSVAAGILPQTASRHLSQLVEAGLLQVTQSGRHRYHRLASAEVAKMLEGLMHLATATRMQNVRSIVVGPRDADMRRARTCYDHIAGRLGVAIAESLIAQGAIIFERDSGVVTDQAHNVLDKIGIKLTASNLADKPISCRPCLDWSERKHHLAGLLGTLICNYCLSSGWLQQQRGTRALQITDKGETHLTNWLGAARWHQVAE